MNHDLEGSAGEPAAPEEASAVSTRTLEIITAVFFLVLGAVVMWDSRRIGAGWSSDGPQSGYFPFYIGLLMTLATLVNLVSVLRQKKSESFVSRPKLKLVMAIFLPCLVYLAVMQVLGLYVSSAIFISVFMRWQGKFSIFKSLLTGVGTSVLLFLMFEVWFKVPLLKGPLESLMGY
jgi:putative tricarboxylic transport membrane protein